MPRSPWKLDKTARQNTRAGIAYLTVGKKSPEGMEALARWLDYWRNHCGEREDEDFVVKEYGGLVSVYRTTYLPRT